MKSFFSVRRRWTPRRTAAVLAVCAHVLWFAIGPRETLGEFIHGVESFHGTVLDAATWQPRFLQHNQTISQDDELIMTTGPYGEFGYSTRHLVVLPGFGVRAAVTITDDPWEPSITNASLRLTTKDGVSAVHEDTLESYIEVSADLNRIVAIVQNFGWQVASVPSVLDTTFILQLERLSDASMRFSAFESDGTPLGSVTKDHGPIDALYVTLTARGASVIFDDVTIVPEPGSGTLLAVLAALTVPGLVLGRFRGNAAIAGRRF